MLIDLHVHSSKTDGVSFPPDELVALASERGLDGICLTDVHTISAGAQAKQAGRSRNILVLVGFEAITDRGHFLVFVPDPESQDPSGWLVFDDRKRVSYASLSETVGARNGILIAAHPYDKSIAESPGDAIVRMQDVSAIEVLNGSRQLLTNELAEELAAGSGLPGVGGSGGRKSLEALGKTATLFGDEIESETDLITCIRNGDVWPVTIGRQKTLRSNKKTAGAGATRAGGSRSRGAPRRGNKPRSRSSSRRSNDKPRRGKDKS